MGSTAISGPDKLAVQLEVYRERLNDMGLDLREITGQTMFPWVGANGGMHGVVIWLGKLGADLYKEEEWFSVRIPDMDSGLATLKRAIPEAIVWAARQ
jgi:hypothetical protein